MTVNIGSSSYTTSQTYDSAGRIDTQTYPASDSYPSGLQIENTYNALGMLERVQSPGGGTVYYQMLDSDHYGKMTSRWLGDGTTTTQSYADHSSRITEQHTQLGSTNVQRLTYAWDSVGNMSSRSDLINGLTETFSYDGLDRLTQAQVGVATPKDYGYNIIGNMTSKSDVGNYAYLATQIHAVSQISNGPNANSYSYNGNGNLQSGSDLPTLTWSSYNKPTQITKGGITYDFSYGTDRKRYKKVHNNGMSTSTTHYLGDSFEYTQTSNGPNINQEYRHVIRAGGTTIAVITNKVGSGVTTKYLHRDHLGSVTAITDTAGSIIERLNYGPWGQRRSSTDWQTILTTATDHRGYTGHEHLDDIGIIHMNGRVYSPKLGKMLSPDPVTQAPEDGQNYNRYSYVNNNPLKYTDPSGYASNDKYGGGGGGRPLPVIPVYGRSYTNAYSNAGSALYRGGAGSSSTSSGWSSYASGNFYSSYTDTHTNTEDEDSPDNSEMPDEQRIELVDEEEDDQQGTNTELPAQNQNDSSACEVRVTAICEANGTGGVGEYIDGNKQAIYSCSNREAEHCEFSFRGNGYGNQVYGAAGLHTASYVNNQGELTVGVNATRVERFLFVPSYEVTIWDRLFRYDRSNPHFDSTFRDQFIGAQENAFGGE